MDTASQLTPGSTSGQVIILLLLYYDRGNGDGEMETIRRPGDQQIITSPLLRDDALRLMRK
jgi:hypothetical protein